MRISEYLVFPKKKLSLYGLWLVLALALMWRNDALAFDPDKVFKGDISPRNIFSLYFKARKNGQESQAVNVLKYAADQGSFAAQWKLARMYEAGDGVERNPLAAFNIFKSIVDHVSVADPRSTDGQFVSNAMVSLGRYYRNGISKGGIAPDLYQARVMFTTAAMVFQNADGQFELARMNLSGDNGAINPRQAVNLLKKADKRGHMGAHALLGRILFDGIYVERNAVQGLLMMEHARQNAPVGYRPWISKLQEESLAMATTETRKKVMAQLVNP